MFHALLSLLINEYTYIHKMLSTISSMYDLLGLASPFLLNGKKLLQSLCNSKLDWDDPVDDEHRVA